MNITNFYPKHRSAYKVLLAIIAIASMIMSVFSSMFLKTGNDSVGLVSAHTQGRPLFQEGAPPTVTLEVPGEVFIGADVTFNVIFDNRASVTGYGPIIDLIIPTNGADGAQNTGTLPDGPWNS